MRLCNKYLWEWYSVEDPTEWRDSNRNEYVTIGILTKTDGVNTRKGQLRKGIFQTTK